MYQLQAVPQPEEAIGRRKGEEQEGDGGAEESQSEAAEGHLR